MHKISLHFCTTLIHWLVTFNLQGVEQGHARPCHTTEIVTVQKTDQRAQWINRFYFMCTLK